MNPPVDNFTWWVKFLAEFIYAVLIAIPLLLTELFHLIVPRKCKNIEGEVALVTGAARGIGREIALELARKGCSIICADILEEENKITALEINKLGQKAVAYTCNITDREAVRELANKAGNVDILVNNAGYIYIDPFLETSPSVIQRIIDINVTAQIWLIEAFLPGMLRRDKGHIVQMASLAGITGLPNAATYSASKHAVVGFMKSLSDELQLKSRHNIKTSCVCPYAVLTTDDMKNRVEPRLSSLQPDEAARIVVQGMRQELSIFTVPTYLMHLIKMLNFLPTPIQEIFRDVFYFKILPRDSPFPTFDEKECVDN